MVGGESKSQENLDRMMTPEEVATYLSVNQAWIYKNWERLEMPFKKVGKLLRINRRRLDEWIDDQPPH